MLFEPRVEWEGGKSLSSYSLKTPAVPSSIILTAFEDLRACQSDNFSMSHVYCLLRI